MKGRLTVLSFIILISFAFLGCDKLDFLNLSKKKEVKQGKSAYSAQVPVEGKVIARVNNIPITLEELNQEVEAYNLMVPADRPELKITTKEQKLDYLKNEMVRRLLLYQEALDRGYERKPEVQRDLERSKRQLLVIQLVRDEAANVDVSSKEIEDYYNQYKDQLKEPEERHILEIVVNTEQEARDILIQLLQGADFATLARERSKAASSLKGGDLGFIKKGEKPQVFDEVAFSDSLEAGKVSNIFKGPDGYYILKLEAVRGGKQQSISDMWDDIKNGLKFLKQQQQIEDLVGKLSRQAKLEIYESEIK